MRSDPHKLKKTADSLSNMKYFCLAMDNYFTLPKVVAALREKNIGVVGTSRFRKNWPHEDLRNAPKESADFNDFYYCVDEHGTLTVMWMDNGVFFFVS